MSSLGSQWLTSYQLFKVENLSREREKSKMEEKIFKIK